ncbi:MAG: HAMP domain-containing sensor histidine kinase [Pseudomonadota bacterium]
MTSSETETPIFDWDARALRITWANRAGLAFWGAASLGELKARPFSPRGEIAQVLSHQSDLFNHYGLDHGWFVLAPGADPLLCRAARSLDDSGGGVRDAQSSEGRMNSVRLELREILDPQGNDFARALAAFEAGPTPQIVLSPDGDALLRNEADRHMFGADASAFSARFREPGEARRALRAAEASDGFALTADLQSAFGPERFQVVMRRFRDPASGDPAILCAFIEAPKAEAEERARIAHDLRSPLNAIQGFAEYMDLAADNLTAAERSAYLADIQGACAAMLTLIETLVDDAAPPAVSAADSAPFSPFQVADAVARLHRQRARRAGGDVVVAIEGAGEALGDAEDARRIVDNLVDNAIRHGGAQVTLTIRDAEVVVSDGGADNDAAPVLSRVGAFGLRNCRDLADGMGASLDIAANEAGGVTARLTFAGAD